MKPLFSTSLAFAVAAVAAGNSYADPGFRDAPPRPVPAQRQGAIVGANEVSQQQIATIRQRADRVTNELEYLLEDLQIDGRGNRDLYQRADAMLQEAIHFRRSLRPGISRDHIVRDFQRMDEQVHGLLESLRGLNDNRLRRTVSRIEYADEQLHYAVYQGMPGGNNAGELIARQAHALAAEADQLNRAAQYLQRGSSSRLADAIAEFAQEADHFHEAFERGADAEHAARDFRELDNSWHRVAELMNRNWQSAYLFRRADRVNTIHNQLHAILKVETPQTIIRFEQHR